MRSTKFKSYEDLPLTLTVPEVGEALGISRAAAYELVRSRASLPCGSAPASLCRRTSLSFGSTGRWM